MGRRTAIQDPLEAAKAGDLRTLVPQDSASQAEVPLTFAEEPEVAIPVKAAIPMPPAAKVKQYRVLEERKLSVGAAMVTLAKGKIISESTNPELMKRVISAKVPLEEI